MVSEKSSIGEISSKISCRPDFDETSSPASRRRATSAVQASLPTSQSKLSVWRERSWGSSRGSEIFANEMGRDFSAELRAANRCPSTCPGVIASPTTPSATGQADEHLRADARSYDSSNLRAPQEGRQAFGQVAEVDDDLRPAPGQADRRNLWTDACRPYDERCGPRSCRG